ncbi:response regulator [Bacteriovorax sp. Seq25_V]|uniref:response regulator n=1 Tax=Bacteriovorax sp. Seq25_V TaxID=1201288 RepID=UPI000389EDA4|nr:response regulator [Bacteriovorax sp. Seq25_V]EQC44027.1 response regulator receiver domain protein [Bacteriovorax sp. Seq25_V]
MKPFLIVDDNHDVLSFLKWELQEFGAISMQADNCQDAIEVIKEIELEAIFLDIVLGHESSEQIITFIRSEENTLNKDVRVVLMSGLIDQEFSHKYHDKFYQILEKPFSSERLLQVLKQLSS